MGKLTLLTLMAIVGAVLSCQPPDCDTPDCGSCGNACCLIDFMFEAVAADVYRLVEDNLKKGGDDMRYRFVGSEDYTSDNLTSGVQYQLQAIHSTMVHHYNDTLDMLIISKAVEKPMTTVRSFSISEIYGAYCDEGQNYKNLVGFVKGLGTQFKQEIVFGCKKNPF